MESVHWDLCEDETFITCLTLADESGYIQHTKHQ